MATRIEDEQGNLLWAPDSLAGKYSVDKVKDLTEIFSGALSDITITVKADSDSLQNTFTKQEIQNLLMLYMLKTDFDDMASQAVIDRTDLYIKNLQDSGKIVTTDTTNALSDNFSEMRRVADFLTNFCFDSSYASVVGWQTAPSIEAIAPKLDNLSSLVTDAGNKVDAVIRDVYVDSEQRTGFKFATTASVQQISDKLGIVGELSNLNSSLSGSADLVAALNTLLGVVNAQSEKIQSLESKIIALEGSTSDLQSKDSELENKDTEFDGKIIALQGGLETFETRVSGLETKVSELESMVSGTEDTP